MSWSQPWSTVGNSTINLQSGVGEGSMVGPLFFVATLCEVTVVADTQWRNMDRRLKLENLNCLILEFFFSKIYFLDQIYWQALVRPFKWHIGKVCIISRKKVTESGKNVKKGLKFVLFHFFDNENGENIFFGPSQLKVPKRWVLMVLKVFQCLLKQKSYKPNKIFLDLLSTNWAFEPLCLNRVK